MSGLLLAAARARGALLVRLGAGRLPVQPAGLHTSSITAARRTGRRAPYTLTAAAAEAAPETEPAPTSSAASFKDLGVDTRLVVSTHSLLPPPLPPAARRHCRRCLACPQPLLLPLSPF